MAARKGVKFIQMPDKHHNDIMWSENLLDPVEFFLKNACRPSVDPHHRKPAVMNKSSSISHSYGRGNSGKTATPGTSGSY